MIAVFDREFNLTYVNPASAQLLGFDLAIETRRDIFSYIHPDDFEVARGAMADVVASPEGGAPFVLRLKTASGEYRFVEIRLTNCLDEPAVSGYVVNGHDVTDQTFLARALQALTEGRKILMSATDEMTLLADVCRNLDDNPGVLLAWVGYVEHDEAEFVRPMASAGRSGFLNEVNLSWSEYEYAQGVIGKTVRTGVAHVVDDVRGSKELTRWWDQAEKFGLLSACALPLRVGEKIIGVLTLHSGEVGFFGADRLALLKDLAEEISYGISRLRDADRLVRNERLLLDSEQRFLLAFEANAAPMLFSDLEDRVIAVNGAFCRMIGYSREEVMGRDSKNFTYPDDVGITEASLERLKSREVDQERYVKRYQHRDGRIIVSEVTRSPARNASGEILYFVISERDVTEERTLAAQLSYQALHDPLTGLANRALFEDRLGQAHLRMARQSGLNAVILIDLDHFKVANDSFGHLAGDGLLVAVARRLSAVMRSSDTLCRFGGDEFLCLLEGLASGDEVAALAQRIFDALVEPFTLADQPYEQRVSMGVALWDHPVADPHEVLGDADIALYQSKSLGRGRCTVFTPTMRAEAVTYFELTRELRRALADDEVPVQFEPIVDLATNEVVAFEAISQWHHPTRGWLAPESILPAAEESDLVVEIGERTLAAAVAAARTWPPVNGRAPYVVVNVSARQFLDRGLAAMVEELLRDHELAPERLVVEISESVAQRDVAQTADVIDELRRAGVGIALDGFGTGYSSFSHLIALNPRALRIDRSLVRASEASRLGASLLGALITFGVTLDMTVLAEGVESAATAERLRALGCHLGQGPLFSSAMSPDEVVTMLERSTTS